MSTVREREAGTACHLVVQVVWDLQRRDVMSIGALRMVSPVVGLCWTSLAVQVLDGSALAFLYHGNECFLIIVSVLYAEAPIKISLACWHIPREASTRAANRSPPP